MTLERFTAGVVQLLEDAGEQLDGMVPGSLRVTVGGSSVSGGNPVATWCVDGGQHRRRTIAPGDLARVLYAASDKLAGPDRGHDDPEPPRRLWAVS